MEEAPFQSQYEGLLLSEITGSDEEWTTYAGAAALSSTCRELAEQTVQKGLPWLETYARPWLTPPTNLVDELLAAPTRLAEQMADTLHFDLKNPAALELVEEALRVAPQPDWALLKEAAACYGEVVRHCLGGSWGRDASWATAAIVGILGEPGRVARPVLIACSYWSRPLKRFGFTEDYRVMQVL